MPPSSYFPVTDNLKQESYWLSVADPISTYRSTPSVPETTDILIIGSGYAGTTTAYYLLKKDPSLKITMVELRNACSGATGRNGGHIKPYYHRYFGDVEDKYGLANAAKYAEFEADHLNKLKRLAEDEGIDCDLVVTRACDVYYDDYTTQKEIQNYHRFMENPYVRQDLKDSVQLKIGEDAKMISNVAETTACITYPAGSIWPWKLITGILKKLVLNSNFNFQTNTMVTRVSKLSNHQFEIFTNRNNSRIIANKVILATNAYTQALIPELSTKIVPVKNSVTRIVPDENEIKPFLSNTYGIYNSRGGSDYLICRLDGSIIIGGGGHTNEQLQQHVNEYYSVDDNRLLPDSDLHFNNYAQRTFQTWSRTKTTRDFTWSGIMGFTTDLFPYIGDLKTLRGDGWNNCWLIAGFHGHGMPRVLECARSIATSVTEGISVGRLGVIPEMFLITKERLEDENDYIELIGSLKKIKSKL